MYVFILKIGPRFASNMYQVSTLSMTFHFSNDLDDFSQAEKRKSCCKQNKHMYIFSDFDFFFRTYLLYLYMHCIGQDQSYQVTLLHLRFRKPLNSMYVTILTLRSNLTKIFHCINYLNLSLIHHKHDTLRILE